MTTVPNKIYPLFAQKIKNKIKIQFWEAFNIKPKADRYLKYKTIISFQTIKERDNFITTHKKLSILKIINVIPSIVVDLNEIQIQEVQKDDSVLKIEEDQELYLSVLDVNEIIGLNNYRNAKIPYTGNNVVIGVIDNGINSKYPAISNIVIKKYTQSTDKPKSNNINKKDIVNHATLMANIIGNRLLDYNGRIIGIAPNVKLFDFNISNLEEKHYLSNILNIFDFILTNSIKLDILLLPLTTLEPSDGNDILSVACNFLVDKGFIIICPAGNFGPESYTIGSPSAAQKVITIGSLTKEMTIAYYSGRGPTLDNRLKPDLCLPGSKVEIPLSNELIIKFSGTSISAALAAGIIALLKENNPNIAYKDVMKLFQNVSIDINYENISQGVGTINIMDLFERLEDYLQEKKIIPYNELIMKSLEVSIEIIVLLIIIYFIINFLNLI